MAYSNLNFGQLLHRIENIDIKNNIRSYEKIKKKFYQQNMAFFLIIYIYLYTNDTIYVLSCVGSNGGIYVYYGNMMYMPALCMTYMVYICYIFLLSVCHAPHRPPCDTPLGLL